MRKLKLQLEELDVVSFDTARTGAALRGTVQGAGDTYNPESANEPDSQVTCGYSISTPEDGCWEIEIEGVYTTMKG
jgi:hypothetical protein